MEKNVLQYFRLQQVIGKTQATKASLVFSNPLPSFSPSLSRWYYVTWPTYTPSSSLTMSGSPLGPGWREERGRRWQPWLLYGKNLCLMLIWSSLICGPHSGEAICMLSIVATNTCFTHWEQLHFWHTDRNNAK